MKRVAIIAATTFEERLRLAREVGNGIPSRGFLLCIEKLLRPILPSAFTIVVDSFKRFHGCDITDDGRLVVSFGYGDRIAELSLDQVPCSAAVPAALEPWIEAYRGYRRDLLEEHGVE